MEGIFSGYNWFDYIIITILFLSILIAFARGFIKSIFSFINWLVAFAVTIIFYDINFSYINNFIESKIIAILVSTIGVFITIFIISIFINAYFVHSLRKIRGGAIDRSFGAVFGLARGIFIVLFIFMSISFALSALEMEDENAPNWFAKAKSYNILNISAAFANNAIPEEFSKSALEYAENFLDKVAFSSGIELTDEENIYKGELSDRQKQILGLLIKAIPKDDMDELLSKYNKNIATLNVEERNIIYKDILDSYKNKVDSGEIKVKDLVSEDDIKIIEKFFKKKDKEVLKETSYNKKNIKQLEILIEQQL